MKLFSSALLALVIEASTFFSRGSPTSSNGQAYATLDVRTDEEDPYYEVSV